MSDQSAAPAAAPAVTLCACGIADTSSAPRCRACPRLAETAQAQNAAPVLGRRGAMPTPPAPEQVGHSRWAKSQTSFGPFGRIVATIALCLPLPVFAFTIASGVGMVGGAMWIFIVMPLGLRDVWKKTKHNHRT